MIPSTSVNVQLQRRLDSLAADFTRWRVQRPHRRAAVPQSLPDSAVALALASSRFHVSKALGVSYTMLNAWSPKPKPQATTRRRGTSHPSTPVGAVAPTFVPLEQTVADAALPAFTAATSSGQRLTIK